MAARKTKSSGGAATAEAPAPARRRKRKSAAIDDQMIAARAYTIWQARGCPQGQEQANWHEAEQQLREEHGLN